MFTMGQALADLSGPWGHSGKDTRPHTWTGQAQNKHRKGTWKASCPSVGPWLPALKTPGPMGRHAAPLLLVQGWPGQRGGGFPWERSRGPEPQRQWRCQKEELLPIPEMLTGMVG